jgi:mono/diheme cytochrome c family protein
MSNKITTLFIAASCVLALACTKKEETLTNSSGASAQATADAGAASDKGIGPVTQVEIAATVDAGMATKGKSTFEAKCAACHKMDERYVGPALKGITQRRKPEWIMNMIMNPVEMTQKDPTAQALLGEFLTQMTFQNVTQDETRAMLEYFRQVDGVK